MLGCSRRNLRIRELFGKLNDDFEAMCLIIMQFPQRSVFDDGLLTQNEASQTHSSLRREAIQVRSPGMQCSVF